MCGRYTSTASLSDLARQFAVQDIRAPRWSRALLKTLSARYLHMLHEMGHDLVMETFGYAPVPTHFGLLSRGRKV